MTTALILRGEKGSELTHAEVDGNFTALRNTADRADLSFAQSRWVGTDFVSAASTAGVFPFIASAVSGGALAVYAGELEPGNFGAVAFRDSATAGGGYSLATQASLLVYPGFAMRYVFKTPGIATVTARIGISNSITAALANNFAFLEIVGLTGTFRARRNFYSNPEVVDTEPFTLMASEYYVLDIDWISDTEIRFVCWDLATGVVARSWVATTAAWPNPTSSTVFPAVTASESTTSAATNILFLDYAGFGPARPGYLTVPV